ncbi:LAQU0S07e02278g1_1 [Lachancea quebecensis]|uniref:U1 small nuclear ribonucleoprotein component SNU71 n=1 Tax=Lachancea quebecensis TaxID=1654605 RepID=A0A0P1KST6_9SACH|nr:LAQU0S07e02278g1_1 [Lachancea quebecensis]
MDSMIYVCPSAYLSSQTTDRWHSETFKPGFVPILRSDLLRFRDVLDQVVSRVNQQKASNIYQTSDEKEAEDTAGETKGRAGAPLQDDASQGKYQELKQFLPISNTQQLCTLSIGELQGEVSISELELFVGRLENLTEKRAGVHDSVECWSFVKGLNTFSLFLRCSSSEHLKALTHYWSELFSRWPKEENLAAPRLHIEENTARFVKDHKSDLPSLHTQDLDEDSEQLAGYFKELRDRSSVPKEDATSIDYNVDVSTLSDLPRSSLDQLCKDIVHFRTRVLTIEKEKRAKEQYEENRRMGQHMMKMFDQIRRSKGSVKPAGEEDEDEGEAQGQNYEDAEDDAEDDWSVEKRNRDKIEKDTDKKYTELLEHYASRVEPRLKSLERQVDREIAYERTIEQERALYLKELLHHAYSPYYDHHRSFKEEEQRRDDEDRKSADQQTPRTAQAVTGEMHPAPEAETGKFKLEIRKTQTDPERDVLPQEEAALSDVLARLRKSSVIQDSVVEFLGELDNDLVDYVIEHLREHRSKPALLQELKETFDEDAQTIVDRVWQTLQNDAPDA